MKKNALLTLLGLALLITACKKDDDTTPTPTPTPSSPTLYQQVGGTTMVDDPAHPGEMIEQGYLSLRSVVDSSIFVVAADPNMQPFFAVLLGEVGNGNTTGLSALSRNLTDFFAAATGSTNHAYGGRNMVNAHDPSTNTRMTGHATNASMDSFIADVVVGAQQNNVPADIIAQFGTLMESLRSQIVQQ